MPMRMVRNRKRRWLPPPVPGIGLAALAAGALCAAPMVGLDGYLVELAASWRPHIALALAICAAMALAVRARLLAAVLVALALALGADVVRTWWDSAQAAARGDMVDGDGGGNGDAAVRVVFSNLSVRNDDTGKFVAWLKVSEPDVVVATEVSPRHVRQMAEAMAEYPFRVIEPRDHPFGMVVYSRYPIAGEAVTELAGLAGLAGGTPPARVPIMVAVDVETPVGPLHVAGFHLYPPMTPRRFARRNEQLAIAADVLAEVDAPKIVVGDFNATPWSAELRAFRTENDLSGFNTRATWPAGFGFAGIPIDHAFVSRDLRILEIETGPDIGSDHRPLLVAVAHGLSGSEAASREHGADLTGWYSPIGSRGSLLSCRGPAVVLQAGSSQIRHVMVDLQGSS